MTNSLCRQPGWSTIVHLLTKMLSFSYSCPGLLLLPWPVPAPPWIPAWEWEHWVQCSGISVISLRHSVANCTHLMPACLLPVFNKDCAMCGTHPAVMRSNWNPSPLVTLSIIRLNTDICIAMHILSHCPAVSLSHVCTVWLVLVLSLFG